MTTNQRGWAMLPWACLGGAWGGALVGLAEACLVTATSAGDEFWIFPFGLLWYGGLGVLLGSAAALLFLLARSLTGAGPVRALGLGASVSLGLLSFVVSRYHVNQRLFGEQLAMASMEGLAVLAGLGVASLLVAGLAAWVGARVQASPVGGRVTVVGLLVLLAGATAGASLAGGGRQPTNRRSTAPSQRPNVILIVVDTLRADALGIQGGPKRRTPNLDSFARESVRFAQAYSQSSWTRPSIASILTSLYPSRHGAVLKLDPLPDEVETIAELLQREGYWTAGFVSNINVAPIFNFQQGFGEYHYLAPSFYFGATDSATRLAIYKGLRVLRERFLSGHMYFYHYYQDAAEVNRAVGDWLDQAPPSPFFLLVHYMDPHDPYFEIPYNGKGVARVSTPFPPAEQAEGLRKLYDEDVTYLDEHLGILLRKLRESGVLERSVIALTADHGEEFQEHGGWWHGNTLYEEQVHVPLLIRRPGEPRAGSVEMRPVQTLDIVPTLLAAAGAGPSPVWQGFDLFAENLPQGRALFAEEQLEGNVITALRKEKWKLVTANPGNPRGLQPIELFDLVADPMEKHNLASRNPDVAQALQREMVAAQARAAGGER